MDVTGKYDGIAGEIVERVNREANAKYRPGKDAEKAAKNALHRVTDAYMTEGEFRRARKLLDAYRAGDAGALDETLRLHASSRERFACADAFFARAFDVCGRGRALDLACGLNPLFLGRMGIETVGIEAHASLVDLVNGWGGAGLPVSCVLGDLVTMEAFPEARVAFLLKLLPVLEQQEKGAAQRLLSRVQAPFLVVSFPTRTLSGRAVGMAENYGAWFEGLGLGGRVILDKWTIPGEMAFAVGGRK